MHTGTSNPAYGDGYVATRTANCTARAVIVVNGTQVAAGPSVSCTTSNGASVHIPATTYTCPAGSRVQTQLIVNASTFQSVIYSPTLYF